MRVQGSKWHEQKHRRVTLGFIAGTINNLLFVLLSFWWDSRIDTRNHAYNPTAIISNSPQYTYLGGKAIRDLRNLYLDMCM